MPRKKGKLLTYKTNLHIWYYSIYLLYNSETNCRRLGETVIDRVLSQMWSSMDVCLCVTAGPLQAHYLCPCKHKQLCMQAATPWASPCLVTMKAVPPSAPHHQECTRLHSSTLLTFLLSIQDLVWAMDHLLHLTNYHQWYLTTWPTDSAFAR